MRYVVSIFTNEGVPRQVRCQSGGRDRNTCIVPMRELEQSPWSLDQGSQVSASVQACAAGRGGENCSQPTQSTGTVPMKSATS